MEQRFPCEFRGLTAFMEASSLRGGRRQHSDEFPFRDEPWVVDLGRKQRRYTARLFLLGDNINEQREQWIDALEQPGTALFQHPRFGVFEVQVDSYHWRGDSSKKSEDFDIEFVEPQANPQTQIADNTLASVGDAATDVAEQQKNAFAKAFDATKDKLGEGRNLVNKGLDKLRKINGLAQGVLAPINDISAAIDSIGDELNDLVRTPLKLFNALEGVVNQTLGLFDDVGNALDAFGSGDSAGSVSNTSTAQVDATLAALDEINSAFDELDPIPAATADSATRQTQQKNRAAMVSAIKTMALVATVNTLAKQAAAVRVTDVSQSPFNSYDHAVATREKLNAQIDAQLLTADYATFNSLQQLKAALHSHLDTHGVTLPRLQNLTVVHTTPALVLAHRQYGDAARAADIVSRNGIRHPLFVDAQTLEVASA